MSVKEGSAAFGGCSLLIAQLAKNVVNRPSCDEKTDDHEEPGE